MAIKLQNGGLIRGTSCWVRAGSGAANAKKIGFCDSFRGTKTTQLQKANVCGELYPVSIDASGVQVTLSISGFIPKKSILTSDATVNGKGENNYTVTAFNPDSANFVTNSLQDVPYIDFYDENQKAVLFSFTNAIASSFSVTGNSGGYIKGDLQMEAIDMNGSNTYTAGDLASVSSSSGITIA